MSCHQFMVRAIENCGLSPSRKLRKNYGERPSRLAAGQEPDITWLLSRLVCLAPIAKSTGRQRVLARLMACQRLPARH
ncbi:hypothetical protein CES85_5750 [Ochrobactrum quorumnocens]|uniref:Uncharacterized protein n=1 Tax=Ochrobactrum quorumnocens TaxID=271865 RepID=A0A248UE52_9HYPH|nr:hypothetical protein CES85_5750 [[Ochrobactrum] quorumnocens]